MTKLQRNDRIRLSNGETMTAQEAVRQKRCEFKLAAKPARGGGATRLTWFLFEVGGGGHWDVYQAWPKARTGGH